MNTLALDLGTACGWAFGADPVNITYGTFDLKHGRFAGGGVRFVRFRQELNNFPHQIDEVTFEIVRRHRGTDAAHVYGGLLATFTAWCEEQQIPYSGETVQAIKIFATGKGNADKQSVVAAVEGWGFSPRNDNEADAIALLRLRMSRANGGPIPISTGRRKVANKSLVRALG